MSDAVEKQAVEKDPLNPETLEMSDFEALLNQEFKPKSDDE